MTEENQDAKELRALELLRAGQYVNTKHIAQATGFDLKRLKAILIEHEQPSAKEQFELYLFALTLGQELLTTVAETLRGQRQLSHPKPLRRAYMPPFYGEEHWHLFSLVRDEPVQGVDATERVWYTQVNCFDDKQVTVLQAHIFYPDRDLDPIEIPLIKRVDGVYYFNGSNPMLTTRMLLDNRWARVYSSSHTGDSL